MKLPERIASFDDPSLADGAALPIARTKSKPSHWTATRLVDALQSRARKQADKQAFTFLEGGEPADTLTFGQLHERARAIGAALRSRGAAGQPVMVVLEPGLRYVASLFGCFYAGSIAVPVYPPDPFRIARMLPRLQAIFSNAACELMIGDSATLGGADNAVRAMAKAAPVLVDELPGAEPNWRPAAPPEEAPAILQYTSGTTGSAKGVAITHANLMYNMRALESLLDVDDAIALHWLPPYHDLGLIGGVLLPAFAGRHTYLMSPLDFMRNPAGWLKAMSRFGATTTASPNFGYELCLRKVTEADCEGLDLSRWRVAVSGAEPVRADTLDRFVERFGPYGFRAESFIPAYGMAETTLMVSVQGLDELPRRETYNADALLHHELAPCSPDDPSARTLVSCGEPGPQVEVKIINPETFAETDGVGEIWVRTPGVASGYWRRPVETEAAFDAITADGQKGWLRTGDLGFMSAGELFVTGRKKEMLILAGRNYYPQDIEAAVQSKHPALKRDGGAVVAVEIDNEERVAVFQEVQRPRKQNLEELLRIVRSTVAEEVGQEPHTVVLLANGEIPKTSSGKLQRSACWDAYQQGVLMSLLEWSQGESTTTGSATDTPAEGSAPEGEMEEWLSACWADVLGVEKVSREDNFIQLGGRSLQVIEMLQRVTERTGRDLQLVAVFEHPTLAQFAAYIESAPVLGEGMTSAVAEYSLNTEEESLPAAPNQHRFWLLDQLGVGQGGANVPLAMAFEGPLDTARMQRAIDVLVERHEALRARFLTNGDGELRQLIESGAKLKLQTIELPAGEHTVAALAGHDFAWSSIDTERAPLAKAAVVAPQSDNPMLLLVLHHMVCDRAAANLLINDLAALYAGEELPPVEFPYHAAVALASQPIDERHADADHKYWRDRLAALPPSIDLPLERASKSRDLAAVESVVRPIDRSLAESVSKFAVEQNATPFLVYLSAFHLTLSRYTPDENIGVGVAVSTRLPQERDTVGCFINVAPIAADVSRDETYHEFLLRLRGDALSDLQHARAPWEDIVAAADKPRVAGRVPLVQTFFLFDETEAGTLKFGDNTVDEWASDYRGMGVYDVTLVVESADKTPTARLVYEPSRVPAEVAERMLETYLAVLTDVHTSPNAKIQQAAHSAQSETELLREWSAPTMTAGEPAAFFSRFASQVNSRPDSAAVTLGDESLSYAELDALVDRIAAALQSRGVKSADRVGLLAERSPRVLASMLALWKLGAAYVPFDPTYPDERAEWMADDASLAMLIVDELHASRAVCQQIRTAELTDLAENTDARVVVRPNNDSSATAYLMYTSGSTGRPKGVVVPRRAVDNLLESFAGELSLGEHDRVLAATSVSFDISVLELFLPLATGAEVVMARCGAAADPEGLAKLARSTPLTMIQGTPSTFRTLLAAGWMPTPGQRIVCGGEELPADLARLLSMATDRLWNVYGPTETTVWSTVERINTVADRVPIGKPISRTTCTVVDNHGRLAPIGVWGELLVGGAGVADGYWRRPELTAKRFIASPVAGGERVYRTGDVARWRADGVLEFAGRRDNQVKVRGHRIELGEVEAALTECQGIAESAVIVQTHGQAAALTAFVAPSNGKAPSPSELRSSLARRLPEAMIPSAFVVMPSLPKSASGKVDRASLKQLDAAPIARSAPLTPPRDEEEKLVAEVWREKLELDAVGVLDNFFELGGHSQLAIEVMVELEQRAGVRLPLAALFETPTIENAAKVLRNPPAADPNSSLAVLQHTGEKAPLFCLHPAGGTVFCYSDLARHFAGERPVIGIQALGVDGRHAPHESMQEMVDHYRRAIEEYCPTGPVHLCGWSLGGNVAYELARQLRADGREVGLVALFDSGAVPMQEDVAEDDLMPLITALFPDMEHMPLEQLKAMDPQALVAFFSERAARARLIDTRQLAAGGFILDVFTKNMSTFVHHRPGKYDGPVLLFRAGLQATMHAAIGDRALGWDAIASQLEVLDVDSDHTRMMNEPHVNEIAAGLQAALDRLEG